MNKIRRLNKKYTLHTDRPIQVKYGTTNRENPRVIYLAFRCWLVPHLRLDYKKALDDIKQAMRQYVKDNFANGYDFDKKFIIDFDLNLDNMGPSCKKRKYFTMDVFLRQREDLTRKIESIKEPLGYQAKMLGESLHDKLCEYDFSVYLKKNGE